MSVGNYQASDFSRGRFSTLKEIGHGCCVELPMSENITLMAEDIEFWDAWLGESRYLRKRAQLEEISSVSAKPVLGKCWWMKLAKRVAEQA
ncbi:MAG TPA: hypothetical protein VFO40_15620 [Chthoniobacterales bacterium]|nr:hypothetical protein [Chthoniobacterales bacterium]